MLSFSPPQKKLPNEILHIKKRELFSSLISWLLVRREWITEA